MVVLMKKLLIIMILTLLFNGNVYANKISLIDIKIGDKMNDHFSNKQISKYYVQNPGGTPRGERIMGKDLKYCLIKLNMLLSQMIVSSMSKKAYLAVMGSGWLCMTSSYRYMFFNVRSGNMSFIFVQ